VRRTAMAAPASTTPNRYRVHDHAQGRLSLLQVEYSTSGVDGQPHLHYYAHGQTLNFSGDTIRTMASEIGTLVTVTTQQGLDTGYTSFTLVVPAVTLGQSHEASIKTFGITTVHRTSLAGPLSQAQTEESTITALEGTAEFVEF